MRAGKKAGVHLWEIVRRSDTKRPASAYSPCGTGPWGRQKHNVMNLRVFHWIPHLQKKKMKESWKLFVKNSVFVRPSGVLQLFLRTSHKTLAESSGDSCFADGDWSDSRSQIVDAPLFWVWGHLVNGKEANGCPHDRNCAFMFSETTQWHECTMHLITPFNAVIIINHNYIYCHLKKYLFKRC